MKTIYKLIFLLSIISVSCSKNSTVTPLLHITYSGNGNTGGNVPIDSKGYVNGAVVTVLDNTGSLIKSGFLFSGWNSAADGSGTSYLVNASFNIGSTNTTLYAVWTPQYSVTYDGNGNTGGSVPVDLKGYSDSESVSVLSNSGNLVKSGFYFTGWNTAANGTGTNYSSGNNFNIVASSVTLYAVWKASGSVWTPSTLPNTKKWISIGYGNNTFIATGISTDTCAVSIDGGNTWSVGIMPETTSWNCVGYGAGTFVSLSGLGYAAISPDGINWTKKSLPASYSYTSLIYANNKFVTVAPNSNSSLTSADGITWNQGTLPSTDYWTSVAYGNGTYVAVAGTVGATSSDGINWTARTLPISGRSLAFGNGVFVAVTGGDSNVAVSTDGITWTTYTLPTSGQWALTFGNGIFLATKYNSNIAVTSTDGINWQKYTSMPNSVWYTVAYGGNDFVAISFKNNAAAFAD